MGKTREQIDIIINGQDRASQALASVNKGLHSITNVLTAGMFSMGIREVGQLAWQLAELGGQSARVETSFRSLAGVDPSQALEKLRAASKGTIDDASLLLGANKAMMLGVTDDLDTLSKLMEVAGVRAKAMGVSTTQAYNDIITGIGRVSPLILDNLGILTGGQAGFDEYARTIGKTASDLTDLEKRQYLVNKVLQDTTSIVEGQNQAGRDMAGNLEYLESQWKNFWAAMGQGMDMSQGAGAAGGAFAWLAENQRIANEGAQIGAKVGAYLERMRALGALTATEFQRAETELHQLSSLFQQGSYPLDAYKAAILALLPGIDAANAALGVEMPRNSALYAADVQAEKLEMRLYAAQAAAQSLKSELGSFDAEGLFRDTTTSIYGALAGAMGMPGNRTYTDMSGLAKDAKGISDSQFQYALSLTDTNGQIALWQQRLELVTKGSAEYYDILTRINNLQKGMASSSGLSSSSNELESLVSGILSPTQVTRQDVLSTQFGEYYNKWDEYVRRLRSAATDANSAWRHMIPEDVLVRGADYVEYWVQKQEQAFYSGQLTNANWELGGVNWEGFDRQLQQAMAQKAAKDALMGQAMQRAQAMGLGASRLEVASALGVQLDPRTEGVSAAAQFSMGVTSTDMGGQFVATFQAQVTKYEERWASIGEWAGRQMFEGLGRSMSPAQAEKIIDALGPAMLIYMANHLGGRP